jgi:endoglucanase
MVQVQGDNDASRHFALLHDPSRHDRGQPGSRRQPAQERCLGRRGVMAGGSMLGLASLAISSLPRPALAQRLSDAEREWVCFSERFVNADGRVIDTGNGGISHTEGQGIGMLAAEHAGDLAAFDRIWTWTRQTLRRPDALHSWRYQPSAAVPVNDPNNATDGDLLITFALFRAAERWNDRSYYQDAMQTTRSILAKLIRQTSAGIVLLPGADGFTHADRVVVNPSYYVFPALQRLGSELPHPVWERVWQAGVTLMQEARFGRWQLPADWVSIPTAGSPRPAEQWPVRFSFDAVRVPLYMTWAGLGQDPAVDNVASFWRAYPDAAVPAWADLERGQVAPYAQSSGMVAVRRYVEATRAGRAPVLPSVHLAADYYAAALTLLARMAADRPLAA